MDLTMKTSILLLAMVLAFGCSKHPSDKELVKVYETNSVVLSNLVSILTNSIFTRIEWSGTALVVNSQTNPVGLNSNILSNLKAFGQPVLITCSRTPPRVWFYLSMRGLSVSGSAKGLAYLENVPARIVPDTDASPRTNAPFPVFKGIATNWFIFYER
jgi:hypothetical protein